MENLEYSTETEYVEQLEQIHSLIKSITPSKTITSITDVEKELACLHELKTESVVALFLDSSRRIVGKRVIEGTTDTCTVYPYEIIKQMVTLNANGIILAHNHPARSKEPSKADWNITKKIKLLSEAMGIDFLDHVIFYGCGVTSMRALWEWERML